MVNLAPISRVFATHGSVDARDQGVFVCAVFLIVAETFSLLSGALDECKVKEACLGLRTSI